GIPARTAPAFGVPANHRRAAARPRYPLARRALAGRRNLVARAAPPGTGRDRPGPRPLPAGAGSRAFELRPAHGPARRRALERMADGPGHQPGARDAGA